MATRSAQAKKATAKTTAALSDPPKATKPSKGPKRSTTTRRPSSLTTRQLALLGRLRAGTARPGEVKAQPVSVLTAFMAVILGARVATHELNPRHIYRVPTITTEALGVDLDTARAIRRELGRTGVLKSNGRGVNAASTLTLPDLYQGYLEQTTPPLSPSSPGPRQARATELTAAEIDLLRRLYLGENVGTEVARLENRTLAAFAGVTFALQVNDGQLDPQAADRLRARTRDFLGIDLHRAGAICNMLERDGVILPQGKIGGRRSPAVLNLPALYLQYADMLHAELANTPAAVLPPGLAISLTSQSDLEPSLPPGALQFDPDIARSGIHLTGIADERWVVELILKEGVGRAGHLAYLILQAIQMGSVPRNA